MASYTDKIPTFNPYVQQLPVEEMLKVGMYKQEKYEEGIQKIQTSIDNVAGLDVYKDSDKAYLQSKLNALGNNLKSVAGGDFSDFALVNSVNGMTKQIVKDKNIINAVASTAQIRKGQQDLEAAKKAGKSSVENESFWNDQINNYSNNTDVGSVFSGKFINAIDLNKKYGDIAKDVEAVDYSYDQPFKSDAKGNTLYFDKQGNASLDPKKGTAKYDDAMKRITTKGKSAQTILNNFHDNTTEDDKLQMYINSKYHYKNKSADSIKNELISTYDLQKKQLNQYSTELTVALKSPNISKADKAIYEARLGDIDSKLKSGVADKELANSLAILDDPKALEEYKSKVYTQKYLTNLAQDKSTESYKEELMNNPYAQAAMEKQKFQFDVNKENTRINQWNTTNAQHVYEWKVGRMDKAQAKLDADRAKLGQEPVTHEGAKRTDIPSITSVDINNRINDNVNQLKELNNSFMKDNKGYSKETLNEFANKYDQDPTSLNLKDNDLRVYLTQRRQIEHDNIHNLNLLKGAKDFTAGIDAELGKQFKGFGGIVDTNGKELYSSKDLFSVMKQYKNSISTPVSSGGFTTGTASRGSALDENKFVNRFRGTGNEVAAKAFVKFYNGQPMSSTEKLIVNRAQTIEKHFDSISKDTVKKQLDAESSYFNNHMPENMTMAGTLSKDNKIDMGHTDALISDSMNPELGSLNLKISKDFNAATLQSWREDTKAVLDYQIVKNYDGSGQLIVQKGTEKQVIPMSAQDFQAYYPRYAATNPVTQIKSIIMASPSNTTNVNKRGDAIGAQYTGYNIPSLNGTTVAKNVRYDIEGAKSNVGGKVDGYQVRLYVFDGKIWHDSVLNQQGYIGEEAIQDAVNGIGMDAVNYTLKQ